MSVSTIRYKFWIISIIISIKVGWLGMIMTDLEKNIFDNK